MKPLNQKAVELTNQGIIFEKKGKIKKALESYQMAIDVDPYFWTPYTYVGNILLEQGNLDDAITLYKLALEKNPKAAEIYNNLGTAYAMQNLYGNAIRMYKKALKLNPKFPDALENVASTYASAGKSVYAIKHLNYAVSIYPKNGNLLDMLYQQKRQIADWDKIEVVKRNLDRLTKKQIAQGVKPGEDPFVNVIFNDDPKKNYDIARLWSENISKNAIGKSNFKFNKKKKLQIKIGYLSSHFRDHPTGHLIASLFDYHNSRRFEIFVYSTSPNDNSWFYKKIKTSTTHFCDLFGKGHLAAAKIINSDDIDILIDLDGHTDNNRLQIFHHRPAPIQATYLGFPGTTGASFIDYMITDKIVTPPVHKRYYSEKLAYLPGCYQVNDDKSKISSFNYHRRQFGIPQNAFVFCSFNGTYKIEPKAFEIWMRILKKTPNSILWLFKTSPAAEVNLKHEAQRRGVEEHRLIFGSRLIREKHLKRLSLSDLALDTFTVNGHTTTSDALWAGVPVVTLIGKHFASRVSASILTAANLPELITKTPKDYEYLVMKLAKDKTALSDLKEKLNHNKKTADFFNTAKFSQNLEKLYEIMWETYLKGDKTKDITIKI